MDMVGMPPLPPLPSSLMSIIFALAWEVQNVSVSLVETSLQSLDTYLMSTVVATGSSCVSDGGTQVVIFNAQLLFTIDS